MNFIFDNERPIYAQIIEQFEIAIASGQIAPGEKIQSVRELAATLKVNPNTMQKAMQELESEKLIFTERTNGRFATSDKNLIKRYKEKYAKERTLRYIEYMKKLGYSIDELNEYVKKIGGDE